MPVQLHSKLSFFLVNANCHSSSHFSLYKIQESLLKVLVDTYVQKSILMHNRKFVLVWQNVVLKYVFMNKPTFTWHGMYFYTYINVSHLQIPITCTYRFTLLPILFLFLEYVMLWSLVPFFFLLDQSSILLYLTLILVPICLLIMLSETKHVSHQLVHLNG